MRFRDPRSINLTPLWVLMGVNIMMFFVTSIASKSIFGLSYSLYDQIGINSSTFSSHPWAIVSSMFVHDGIYHIFFNMLSLYFIGQYVLALVGESRFFIVYFVGGLAGNALFMLLAPGATAVGASGAIFALSGVLVILVPRLKVIIFPIPIPMDLWIAIILNLVVLSFITNVAWQAHLGGLLTGLAAGYLFKRQARSRRY